jgi:hypothetical protein
MDVVGAVRVVVVVMGRLDAATQGHEAVEEPARGSGDFLDGGIERFGVARRRLAVTAELAHELEGGCAHLLFGGGVVEGTECFDASAHTQTIPLWGTWIGQPGPWGHLGSGAELVMVAQCRAEPASRCLAS